MEHAFIESGITSWKRVVGRLEKSFEPLTDEQLQKQVATNRNRLFYLLGHLTAVHDRMIPLLGIGERLYPSLDETYITNPDRILDDPLSGAELKAAWREVNAALLAGMEGFTPQQWLDKHAAVSDEDFAKDPSRNRFTLLLNRTNHAAFHSGQVILAR
jgi:hypothetical protein